MVRISRANRQTRRSAFTLVEVLIVVAILVVLAGVGGVTYMKYLEDSYKDRVRMDVKTLTGVSLNYQVKHGEPPATLQTLTQPDADGSRPAITSNDAITDPWGKPYNYDASGPRNNGNQPDIWAVAPDGTTIGNWPNR